MFFGLAVALRAAPPADLKVDGVPEIPPEIQQAVAPYWESQGDAFMDWDPVSGAMLINSVSGDTRQLYLQQAPMGEKKVVTQFSGYIFNGSFMPKLGDRIVFDADHEGDEFYQLYGLDPKGGQIQMLTDGNSRNTNVIYDHTGKRTAFLSTMPESKYNVIYVMDPRKPDSRRIVMTPDNGGWLLEDWAHDGLHFVAAHLTTEGGFLWSVDANTGETRLLNKKPETQRLYAQALYTPDDAGMYVLVLGEDDTRTIDYLPITNQGPVRKVPQEVTKADGISLSPDGKWLAYLKEMHETHAEELHIFNTLTGEEEPHIPLVPALLGRMRWNSDSSELGFNYGSESAPFQAYSYKMASHQLVQWTQSPPVDGGSNAAVSAEKITIHSFDELEISGYLYRPNPQKFPGKRPVLICIHGGPEAEFRPTYLEAFSYYLNQMGVALLYPNVRGSSGVTPDFTDLDDGYKREDSVKDIGAFIDWIATDPRLDSSRVGVQGGSYGGYMVLAALYHYGNKLRCGSDLMGITDFVTFLRNTTLYRKANRRLEYGDERYPEMNKFLESISPVNHAAEIHDPVMITGGKNDPRVPESESDQMVKAIRAQNGIVWSIVGENEGHGFRKTSDAQYQFEAEALFFKTYLMPEKRQTPLAPETSSETKKSFDEPARKGPD